MKPTLPDFDSANILVIGDLMLDRYWHGGTSRISPEAPVPVVRIEQSEDRPGGAGNVALNASQLGATVQLVGVVGDDDHANSLQSTLEHAGITLDLAVAQSHPTITKLRVISQHQQLIRLDHEEPFTEIDQSVIYQKAEQCIRSVSALVLSDYNKGTLQDPRSLIQLARTHDVPVLIDPKGRDYTLYKGATLITPNLHEFETIVGHCHSESVLLERGNTLLRELELEALIITRGEQGMTLIQREGAPLSLPTEAKEVYDVTGAGDTVIATLAAALAAGADITSAAAIANRAAGLAVSKLGTSSVSVSELVHALQDEHVALRKMLTATEALTHVSQAQSRGEKVVFTNGCFDILHAGHVRYLEEASKLGDRLIVAVNSDSSVRRIKDESRPINSEPERMSVLAGLASVDWVVSFEEDTPENLLQMLKPDFLVKGGDYNVEQVVGAETVEGYGGEVRVLGLTKGCSTTSIIDRIAPSR